MKRNRAIDIRKRLWSLNGMGERSFWEMMNNPRPPSSLTAEKIHKAKELLDANEVPEAGRYFYIHFHSRYGGKRRRRELKKWNKGMLSRFI